MRQILFERDFVTFSILKSPTTKTNFTFSRLIKQREREKERERGRERERESIKEDKWYLPRRKERKKKTQRKKRLNEGRERTDRCWAPFIGAKSLERPSAHSIRPIFHDNFKTFHYFESFEAFSRTNCF